MAGPNALSAALMRLNFAGYAESALMGFYNGKVKEGFKTENLFPQLHAMMQYYGEREGMTFQAGLPVVPQGMLARFNRSKLILYNQWESHPRLEDRLQALATIPSAENVADEHPAHTLLDKLEYWQKLATTKMFTGVIYEVKIRMLTTEEFKEEIKKEHAEFSLDPIYNGYYDSKYPLAFDLQAAASKAAVVSHLEMLFSDAMVEGVYAFFAQSEDLATLKEIAQPKVKVKTFDYDGRRYKKREAPALVERLETEYEAAKSRFLENDICIFQHAYSIAQRDGKGDAFIAQYSAFHEYNESIASIMAVTHAVHIAGAFIAETLTVHEIHRHMLELKAKEREFKQALRAMRNSPDYAEDLDADLKRGMPTFRRTTGISGRQRMTTAL